MVIEDERDLCEDIAKKLRLSGYEADTCVDGEAALELLAVERYDLVLLDLNLPKVDGMTVLRTLREHDQETGVLILSARSEISDKVDGLDAGANDYLSKPFHLEELEARVRSLTRRRFVQQDVCLRCGGLTFDTRSRTATADGQTLSLTRKESGILEYLLLNRGRPISQEELIEHVWDSSVDSFSNSIRDAYLHAAEKTACSTGIRPDPQQDRSGLRDRSGRMSKRISVQWRITILTALLIAAACVSLNLLLFYSGSDSMDALNGFVVEYKTGNQQEMTIEIPQENMQAFFSGFSQQVSAEKVRFERMGWCITALVTLLSAVIAYFVSGRALKPLGDFARQTGQINEESLTDTRLSEDTTAEFRQLSESVNGMLDRLAQAFDAQRQFTGNAAHELRTPLALMQTRLELFAAEHQQMSEETAKLLHFQQEQVERLSALVRTLLEMSDLRSVPRTDRIDLAPMVEEVLVDLTPLAQKNGITLTQAGENVQLVGSDVLLYRLLFNLTENAIKYNRTGGSVEVSVEQEGGQAAIRVRDTGPGIAEEYRDSIFQPFFRVDKSRSRASGRRGTGLALVQEIVRLHGGTVRVEQSADTGTTILVTLPVGKAA